LLTGNLWIRNALLVNSSEQPIIAPVIGEEVFVEAQWESSGLSSSDQYTVEFSVDGVALDSSTIDGQTGDDLSLNWSIGGWFATPGSHTVRVTVDPARTVAETSYNDNSLTFSFAPVQPATLPQKLALPIAGVPFQSWSIVNYVDVNPLPGPANDYRGGSFTYDGHGGYDLVLPDFAHMDAGVPVFAAASGTITQVQDGNFDRQTSFGNAPANFVDEDLGDGWEAQYYHLMMTSIAVHVGQTVQAGQLLGLVGSSGDSTAPHLHFDLVHDGDLVETFYQPDAYWLNPLPLPGRRRALDHRPGHGQFRPDRRPGRAPRVGHRLPVVVGLDRLVLVRHLVPRRRVQAGDQLVSARWLAGAEHPLQPHQLLGLWRVHLQPLVALNELGGGPGDLAGGRGGRRQGTGPDQLPGDSRPPAIRPSSSGRGAPISSTTGPRRSTSARSPRERPGRSCRSPSRTSARRR
jgi:murein DD-endopeptidase MepM/ murein hydrolase activator NlpD